MTRRSALRGLVAFAFLLSALARVSPRADQGGSAVIADAEFWRLVTTLSEPGGVFQPQLMSNEDSAQFVLTDLGRAVPAGGVYLGVGSEQNFTYLATLRPRLSFVIDIRSDNLLQMLLYKALFEMADTRAEFVSKMFSRPVPDAPPATDANAAELFAAFSATPADASLLERTTREVADRLTGGHSWPLSAEDIAAIGRMLEAFHRAGPFELRGYGDRNPSYAELMAATDDQGHQQSYLATEARYRIVRDLQRENRIVPLTGDFAGEKALRQLAAELTRRGDRVSVFYVSNVERYLWQQQDGRRFYENVRSLPREPNAVFIRSLTTDISIRQNIPIPPGTARWRTLLFPIAENLDDVASGRIQTYRDLFIRPQPR